MEILSGTLYYHGQEGSDVGLIVYEGDWRESIRDRKEYLLGQGWYQENQLEEKILIVALSVEC